MGDDDLIRRGDALQLVQDYETIHDRISLLPAIPAADARAEALKEAAAAIDPAIFDHPSVYMNGPSYQAQRKAKAISDMILALIPEKQP